MSAMYRQRIVIASVLLAGMLTVNRQSVAAEDCPIFPVPKEYRVKAEDPVVLAGPAAVVVGENAEEPEKFAASRLNYVLKKRFGLRARTLTEKKIRKKTRNLLILGTLEGNMRLQLGGV